MMCFLCAMGGLNVVALNKFEFEFEVCKFWGKNIRATTGLFTVSSDGYQSDFVEF